jgi:import inner membrane translocase subunit TIM23
MSDMDSLVAQIPLDPFITLGLITFTCGGIGWLMGPIVGTGIFNVRNRKFRAQMDEKEKEFYKRVKRYRVDPSASSMANPVPGEFKFCLFGEGEHLGS